MSDEDTFSRPWMWWQLLTCGFVHDPQEHGAYSGQHVDAVLSGARPLKSGTARGNSFGFTWWQLFLLRWCGR